MELVNLKRKDNFNLAVYLYEVSSPKAWVQIIHGALEYQGRYQGIIKFLNEKGYSVIASDHRGHGASIDENYELGYMKNYQEIIEDLVEVTKYAKKIADIDVYLIGHSMGSMLTRLYLMNNDNLVNKVVLSGVCNHLSIAWIGVAISKFLTLFSGKHGFSPFLKVLYNKPSDNKWLSYNEENVIKFNNDSLVSKNFKNQGYTTIFQMNRDTDKKGRYRVKNSKLPILFLSGIDDICIGKEKGFNKTFKLYEKLGYTNIKKKLYPNCKHEIFLENNKEEVFEDVYQFLKN